MIDLGPHAGFIIASYAAAFAIVAGLLSSSLLAYRQARRRLADLEARGLRRRSDERP